MKENDRLADGEQLSLAAPAKSKWHVNLLGMLVCLLLALLIWLCIMSTPDTDYIPLRLDCTSGSCLLSAESVQVEASVNELKGLKEICVSTEGLAPGTYILTEEFLKLPDGVRLVGTSYVILTVAE